MQRERKKRKGYLFSEKKKCDTKLKKNIEGDSRLEAVMTEARHYKCLGQKYMKLWKASYIQLQTIV